MEVVVQADTDSAGSPAARGATDRAAAEPGAPDFTPGRRAAFRFAFIYLVLYCFPFPLGRLPGSHRLGQQYEALWNAALPWIGKHVLRLSYEVRTQATGSGDTTAVYIQLLCFVVLAALGTVVWSVAGRGRRAHDRTLLAWLHVYIRYTLAATLLTYAFAKIFKSQFPFPGPERLLSPFGQMSPMGLLWRFMGYSTLYTVFTGLSEAVGGALLFFRRTTTLGALIVAGVMLNVMMLNFAYDVPVKMYSTHLFLMAVFLTLPDMRRLVAVFLLNRPAAAADLRPVALFARFRRSRLAIKAVMIVALAGGTAQGAWAAYTTWGAGAPRPALYGAYEVESFEKNGVAVPPLLTESTRWRYVSVNQRALFTHFMNDTRWLNTMPRPVSSRWRPARRANRSSR
jgi:hypothetical protein